ncbi:hypothetical protein [Streptomyces sp. SD15]
MRLGVLVGHDPPPRTGISRAGPALLSAAATAAGRELSARMRAAHDEVREQLGGSDDSPEFAVETWAATARPYASYAVTCGAAFELILADELQDHPDAERRDVTRRIMDLVLWPAITVTGNPAAATDLLWRYTAVVHGFAHPPGRGFVRGHAVDVDLVADQAADVMRTLARACAERR